MGKQMGKQMGKSKIRYTNDKVPWYYSFNPGGFGCSGCPLKGNGCWSEGVSRRLGKTACPQCKAFVPHLHDERLPQPGNTKKPGVVLVNFTCDTFDNARRVPDDSVSSLARADVSRMLSAARDAPWHTYVWLTKQPQNVAPFNNGCASFRECDNWCLGLSICNQEQADAKLPTFLKTPGQLWLSLEPLWGAVDLQRGTTNEPGCLMPRVECEGCTAEWYGSEDDLADGGACPVCECSEMVMYRSEMDAPRICGVIVGHDNRKGAPGTDTLDHVRSVVKQCVAAGVPVFVKQLHISGKLRHDPADFPEDLRHRDLPWSMPT